METFRYKGKRFFVEYTDGKAFILTALALNTLKFFISEKIKLYYKHLT